MKSQAKRNRIKEAWFGLPETWRTRLISLVTTFIAGFLFSVGQAFMASDAVSLESITVWSTLLAATRAGVKAIMEIFVVQTLPDPKE